MSVEAVKWALNVKTGHGGRKAILLVIAEHADKNGANSFPDHKTIAAQSDVCERLVPGHIKQLVADGIVNPPERRFDRRGHRISDNYSLNMTASPNGTRLPLGPNSTRLPLGGKPQRQKSPIPNGNCVPLHIDEPPLNHPKEAKQPRAREREEVAGEGTKAKLDHVEQPKPPAIGATWCVAITAEFRKAGYADAKLPDTDHVEQWLAAGYDLPTMLGVIRSKVAKKKDIGHLSYFDTALAEAHARHAGRTNGGTGNGANGSQAPSGQPQGKWWEDEAICEERVGWWLRTGGPNGGWWNYNEWGSSPDQRGCAVPKEWTKRWTDEHEASENEKRLHELYQRWKRDGTWPDFIEYYGPEPGMPGSKVTEELIAKWEAAEVRT